MYEKLQMEAMQHGVDIYEKPMHPKFSGLYSDQVIWINKLIPTQSERACILAEELGHYHTSTGDILDQNKTDHRKQEKRARTWAHQRLFPLSKIVQAHKEGIRNRYELAEFLNVTEEFLEEALKRYQEIYGPQTKFQAYTISFNPLGVVEYFD